MTIAGFLLAVAVIGVVLYAWYYFVHRNGTYNAAVGDDRTNAAMPGSRRVRPTRSQAAFGAEVGEIGERDEAHEEHAQLDRRQQVASLPAPIRMRMQDGTLNHNVEVGAIGEPEQAANAQGFTSCQVQQQMRQDAQQAFSSEVGMMGEAQQQSPAASASATAQAPSASFTSTQVQQQMRQDAQQAFSSEVGAIGESYALSQQGVPSAQQNASQAATRPSAAASAMQKYSVEAGEIGSLSLIDGAGNMIQSNQANQTVDKSAFGQYPPQMTQQASEEDQQQQ